MTPVAGAVAEGRFAVKIAASSRSSRGMIPASRTRSTRRPDTRRYDELIVPGPVTEPVAAGTSRSAAPPAARLHRASISVRSVPRVAPAPPWPVPRLSRSHARRPPRGLAPLPEGHASQALDPRDPPGCGQSRAPWVLPRRVHLSIQPPHVRLERQALLPPAPAGHADHSCAVLDALEGDSPRPGSPPPPAA